MFLDYLLFFNAIRDIIPFVLKNILGDIMITSFGLKRAPKLTSIQIYCTENKVCIKRNLLGNLLHSDQEVASGDNHVEYSYYEQNLSFQIGRSMSNSWTKLKIIIEEIMVVVLLCHQLTVNSCDFQWPIINHTNANFHTLTIAP